MQYLWMICKLKLLIFYCLHLKHLNQYVLFIFKVLTLFLSLNNLRLFFLMLLNRQIWHPYRIIVEFLKQKLIIFYLLKRGYGAFVNRWENFYSKLIVSLFWIEKNFFLIHRLSILSELRSLIISPWILLVIVLYSFEYDLHKLLVV